jgi:DNA invertase Pin-like site-specific DNA recombinase
MQVDALIKAGCKRLFTDKVSGAQVERPGLREALSQVREADTLVVWKLDRLGRSLKGLVDLVNKLETQKVHFQSSYLALRRLTNRPLLVGPKTLPQHVLEYFTGTAFRKFGV